MPLGLLQAYCGGAGGASQAGLYRVFLAGLVPRLQFQVPGIGPRAAEREGYAVIVFEVGYKLFGRLQLTDGARARGHLILMHEFALALDAQAFKIPF